MKLGFSNSPFLVLYMPPIRILNDWYMRSQNFDDSLVTADVVYFSNVPCYCTLAFCHLILGSATGLNPHWHDLWKQEKCSPRWILYKTQWACQGVKLTWLMSIFISKKVWKFLIKIQLTKSDPKRTRVWKVPSLMPIRVKTCRSLRLSLLKLMV